MVKVKAAAASGNAVVSIYLGEAAEPAAQVTGPQGDSWIILRDLDWSGTVNVLRMVVEPPEGTGLSAKTYTVRISRALTAAELEADRDALRLGGGDSTVEVSADLDLPKTGASGLSSITWDIQRTGCYKRQRRGPGGGRGADRYTDSHPFGCGAGEPD